MKKLYSKNEILFSVLWIVVYVVGASAADGFSQQLGREKIITLPFLLLLSIILLGWIKKNGLMKKYGLCATDVPAARFLFYIPLAALSVCNLWTGIAFGNSALSETLLYIGSMICVGFLEELIFRGLLFRAMCQSSMRSAIIVSSVTFGIGHIINLFNGSGADLVSNLCQVISAIAFGFLFVILFHRGKSLLPCIFTHSIINSLSIFSADIDSRTNIILSAVITAACVIYTLILAKTLPKAEPQD